MMERVLGPIPVHMLQKTRYEQVGICIPYSWVGFLSSHIINCCYITVFKASGKFCMFSGNSTMFIMINWIGMSIPHLGDTLGTTAGPLR